MFVLIFLLQYTGHAQQQPQAFRPPALPLIVCNPYFSFWSFADHPGTDWTRHWTGSTMGMSSMVTIDGKTYRLLGRALDGEVSPMQLVSTELMPTSTTYTFMENGCRVRMKFLNPLLPGNLEQLSKSMGFIDWEVTSTDGNSHDVSVYFDCSAEPAVNHSSQEVQWNRLRVKGLEVLSFSGKDQPVLQKKGDDLRIDWGSFYSASATSEGLSNAIVPAGQARWKFKNESSLPGSDDLRMPRQVSDEWPVHAWMKNFGKVSASKSWTIVLAYDEGFNTEFLFRKLRPFWKANGAATAELLIAAFRDHDMLDEQCSKFDSALAADLEKTGGEAFRNIAVLAYRQALGAHGLSVDLDGTPYYFPKENFSNGCIATLDVIYPASPILLFFNPGLLKACLDPIFRYVETGRWKFPFAPHDLGTYPLANGQVYGGGEVTEEDQMPVEETGNMLIMMYAIAVAEQKADYPAKYYPVLQKWAAYLKEKGFDPENQLCTDDFAGHLAHNTNLSIKAILALEAFSKISAQTGHPAEAAEYHEIALEFSRKWKQQAADNGHYRLAFDKPGTWSQKYNLVWDKVLGLNLFDESIAKDEIRHYLTLQNEYGLPLDNRADYTKSDWIIWTATIAGSATDFESLIRPLHRFYNDTRDRKPMTDWYDTKTCRQVGFQARSVVGGVYMKMLSDREMWLKWAKGPGTR